MLDKTSSIICAFGLASAAPRSPYRHLELCGIALMPDWIKIAVLIGQNIGFVRLRFYYTHFKLCCWQSFCGFPRPQLYPHGKRRCSAPGAPAQQAEADLARIKEVRSCRKSNGISKRSNESGWLFSGRCVSDTPSCLGENPGRAT